MKSNRSKKIVMIAAAVMLVALCALPAGCRKKAAEPGPVVVPTPEPGVYEYQAIDTAPKTDWNARWIWAGNDAQAENTWTMFRYGFELERVPEELVASISADSRYWLYVNGQLAVYEGGLKRGPDGESGYYDSIDLAPFLKTGKNVIACEVWYWGKDGSFSYIDSGSGGFLFEAAAEGVNILSGADWKAAVNPAYLNDTGDKQPNYRLPEFNILYDARRDLGNWTAADFDDSGWANASEFDKGGAGAWGTLYPRPIPFVRTGELTDYENSAKYTDKTTKSTEYLTLDIPYNAQCVPYLCVEAPAGKEIEITTENTHLGSVITRYITKEGRQEFESRGWFNGEHVTYKIPAGVKVIALKYRESGYDTAFSGSFSSGDAFFDTLWQKSLRTLYVTMRDNFMDCPDRERAQWWGDVTNEMAMTMYAMDSRSYLLYQKGVFNMLTAAEENGVLKTVVPAGEGAYFELPMQQLAGICGFKTYYMYTGDREFVDRVYEAARKYLELWSLGPNGLVVHRGGSWDWMDWGERADVVGIENAWYYKALDTVRYFAELRGDEAAVAELTERMETIYGAYQLLWVDGKGFMGSVKRADDRANALAVLAGLADLNNPERFGTIKKVLTSVQNASPYMERYVLDALCEMGLMKEAQARIRQRYKDMVADEYSTLWEFWDKNAGTLNHAWSGGPLLTMSQYMAGVAPVEAGYSTYAVRPALGELQTVSCTVPTVRGSIVMKADAAAEKFALSVTSPAGTKVIIGLPRVSSWDAIYFGGTLIYAGGVPADPLPADIAFYGYEADRVCFIVDTGAETRTLDFEVKTAADSADNVTLTVATAEHGRITVNGAEGTEFSFSRGAQITLEAIPADGYELAWFTGSAGGRTAEVQLTADGSMTVGAEFVPGRSVYYKLTVFMPEDADLKFTVNGKPAMFRGGKAEVIALESSELKLEAGDGLLYRFLNYSGDASGDERALTLTLNSDMSIMISTNKIFGDNLAVGARVTCSKTLESAPTWSAANLTDGKLTTGFTTNVLKADGGVLAKPWVISIDLGRVVEFSAIALMPRTDTLSTSGGTPCFPMEFNVKVSRGGSDYTDAGTFTQDGNPCGVVQAFDIGTVKARYIKIEVYRVSDYAADEQAELPYRVQLGELMVMDRK
ncbi:MAG: discoidin domain-containing protein [Clostridia bacterium]|nr:discoidin domain-containing protein [Clostridia bacterium]